MAWFLRGVQSAVFHYASCAPCTGFLDKKHRRKQAKQARKVRTKLQLENPELYHHPEPTGTNPYWHEEMSIGPGPPPRRAKRTGSTRAITTAGTQSSQVTQGENSFDASRGDLRLSEDTLDDDNWNRKRYQREDEDLWGTETIVPLQPTMSGSSVGVIGITRPSLSHTDSYYSARAPPVNDLHPPIVSLPSPQPADNRWMLQPPPRASVMSGKERATNRSRSGSGASSRVELSLQRQVSSRQLKLRLERGETPERSMSRSSFYSNRPISAASSRKVKRRDTAMTKTETIDHSSGESSETIIRRSPSLRSSAVPGINVIRVRTSRQQLSTVMSSGSGNPSISPVPLSPTSESPSLEAENALPDMATPLRRSKKYSTQSSDSTPYYSKRRVSLTASDRASLNILQNLVSPRTLLNTHFVSAPLIEAKIKLPPSDTDEEKTLGVGEWAGSGFAISRGWGTDMVDDGCTRVPFDSEGMGEKRDPRMRWSVDF
ncbi:hypothetical protein P280DRAFT_116053 [Massarina eburnea CBS 473.64]|uniref:Uncharacterized protein n=1 Tax=Massarina eburnea CBS 473.64 TaxID=1395130 RepID=A0A6A6SEY9_9PLEO|nr:hypothetical protein P280DRAFT_116053 [Massarina eburnea CBS 473.64]